MKSEPSSKYFPPPQFLNPPRVGISFSDSSIRAIYFDKTLKEPTLKSAEAPLERGVIVAGSIVNVEEVTKKLSEIREKFDSPFVFFTVPDELAYVFSTSIMVGSGGNATESIAFIMEENVPLSLGDTVFDFMPTKIEKSGTEYDTDFVVAACVKNEVTKFVEVLRRAGFEPLGCIHESQAIAQAVIQRNFTGTSAVIHARGNRVGIYLVKNNLVYFSTLRSIVGEDYINPFLDEYKKFMEYCLKLEAIQNEPIEHVFVCGEFEYAKRVVESLLDSDESSKSVKLSNVWTNVFEIDKHLPEISYEKSLGFAGPIGAVLSDII
jgi:hypothetical protein